MVQFKRIITHLLRVHRQFRQPPRPRHEAVMAANAEVLHRVHAEPCEPAPLLLETQVPPLPLPLPPPPPPSPASTDTDVEILEVEQDALGDDGGKDEDIPEILSSDPSRKTHIEMMVHSVYVATSDNDREIAALRTQQGDTFSHVVRVAFELVTDEDQNIMPSNWSWQAGSRELRLRCPTFARHLDDESTALSKNQLLAARDYIYFALPDGNGEWEDADMELPSWREGCQDSKILIVGPPDRTVDVMTILVSYLAFLTDEEPLKLLQGLRRLKLGHQHWRTQGLGATTLRLAKTVAKHRLLSGPICD